MSVNATPVESVKVLNGVARVGDTVALAVRDGNLAAIRVGVVTEFTYRKEPLRPGGVPVVRMKIRVTHTSSPYHSGRVIGVELFDRVVVFPPGAGDRQMQLFLAWQRGRSGGSDA